MRLHAFAVLLAANGLVLIAIVSRFSKQLHELEANQPGAGLPVAHSVERSTAATHTPSQADASAQHLAELAVAPRKPSSGEGGDIVCWGTLTHSDLGRHGAGGAGGTASRVGVGSGGGDGGQQTGLERDGGGQRHRLAVVIPFRDRESHLRKAVPHLALFLERQGRAFDIFVMEQSADYRFNRGALLNAAVLMLQHSAYDYFAFQDVDTLPTEEGNVPYDFPANRPMHLTPPGLHPKVRYEDFFGGITLFSAEQLHQVNGYGVQFWGWGREDDNMRERLLRADMWPPDRPDVPARRPRFYFKHLAHHKAPEVRVKWANGTAKYFESNPDKPYDDAVIVSSQPGMLQDCGSGLNTTRFRILSIMPYLNATRIKVQLGCDQQATPWCVQEGAPDHRGGVPRWREELRKMALT